MTWNFRRILDEFFLKKTNILLNCIEILSKVHRDILIDYFRRENPLEFHRFFVVYTKACCWNGDGNIPCSGNQNLCYRGERDLKKLPFSYKNVEVLIKIEKFISHLCLSVCWKWTKPVHAHVTFSITPFFLAHIYVWKSKLLPTKFKVHVFVYWSFVGGEVKKILIYDMWN